MSRWLHHFPLDQFHFVNGDELVHNPVHELRRVERFLNISKQLTEDQFYLNHTRGFYCIRGREELGVSDAGSMGVREPSRCLAASKGRTHPNIPHNVIKALRRYFKPHNEQFYRLIGVDFGWATE